MKIFKLMTAVLAVGAMASCSDDLGLESQNLKATKGGLSATIDSPVDRMATRLAVNQTGGVQGGTKTVVFGNEEQLRVFTLNQLQQDLYQIAPGQGGSTTADFNQIVNNNLTGQLYAVTEASSVYGISAYQDGAVAKPLLTLTLPGSYTSESDAAGMKNFPIPFWGPATVSDGNEFSTEKTLSTKLTGLTAILRVSAKYLPKGTKAIVLTTHGRRDLMQYENGANKEGFQIVTPEEKNQIGGFNDLNSWWEDNVPYTLGGKSEPISGTLNCVLDKDDINNTYLKVDSVENGQGMNWGNGVSEGTQYASRLVTSDTLRVKLPFTVTGDPGQAEQVFYIPIVVGHYDNLRVLAVTGDSKYTYRWIGYEMYNFIDQTFERNQPYYLDMSVIELGASHINKLNWAIDQFNTVANRTTLIEVDSLYYYPGQTKYDRQNRQYPYNQVEISGAGNVVINIKAIGNNNNNIGQAKGTPLLFVNRDGSAKTASTGANHDVEINVPETWDANGDDVADEVNYMKVLLGDANVTLGTANKLNNYTAICEVLASNKKYVSSYDYNPNALHETNASLDIVNGFKEIDVLTGHSGDIHVYNALNNNEEIEISDLLNIITKKPLSILLTDALVKKLEMSMNAAEPRYIFSEGSSAIGAILRGDGNEYKDPALNDFDVVNLADAISAEAANADAVNAGVTMVTESYTAIAPNQVIMKSYWTGKALSYNAIQKGYDVSTIYTAAQLASIGEGGKELNLYNPYTEQEMVFGSNTAPYTANYVIPKALVRLIWLGDNDWHWLGSQVTVNGFTLNGENVELKNMWLLTELEGEKYWSDDPHICCTSCINLPSTQYPKYLVGDNLGLIRSIINEDFCHVWDINLNDVMYDNQQAQINNVGSIVGYVESPSVTFNDNIVGEIKLKANTENLGGIAGRIVASEILDWQRNEAFGHSNESGKIESKLNRVGGQVGSVNAGEVIYDANRTDVKYVKGDKNFVAGHVGELLAENAIECNENYMRATVEIVSGGKYVGGLSGYTKGQDTFTGNDNEVIAGRISANGISGDSSHAGGLVGYLWLKNDIELIRDQVTANSISGASQFVGGFTGQIYSNDENVLTEDAIVKVANSIYGTKMIGGLFGDSETLRATKKFWVNSADVKVGTIKGSLGYVGGIHGRATTGQFFVGYETPRDEYERYYTVKVEVDKMAGALAVGGIMGQNSSTSNQSPLFIRDGKSATWNPNKREYYWTQVIVDVKDWEITKTIAYFGDGEHDAPLHYLGTFGNILGMMHSDLNIDEQWDVEPQPSMVQYGGGDYYNNAQTYLVVYDRLTSAKKAELLFREHPDQHHNNGITQYYWGDGNGYLGWNATQSYYIDGVKQRGEQIDIDNNRWGHNIFLKDEVDTDVYAGYEAHGYADAKTKLQ